MMIDEVIELLREIKRDYGDLPVYISYWDDFAESEADEDSFDVREPQRKGADGELLPKRLTID